MVTRESCIEKLEQFILDEDRIVTYKVLSQELQMHVNIAKQYLADFFSIQKSKNVSLQVTYFLAGIMEANGEKSMKVLVVSENNLGKMKKLFSEVTSCHIYSISKNKLDECSILITERHCNNNVGESNKYSAIKHPGIETKTPVLKKINVLNNSTKGSVPKKQETVSSKNGGSSLFQKNSNVNQTEKKDIEDFKTENNSEARAPEKKDNSEKPKTELKSQKSNPLTSMWQKKEDKSKDNKGQNSKTEVKSKTKSPAGSGKNVAKNNIMSMFSKQAAKNLENPKKESVTPVCNKEIDVVTPEENSEDSLASKANKNIKPIKSSTSTKRKSTSRQSKTSSKQKSDNESDGESKPRKKKHRRICTFDDSDSESENEEDQDRAQRSLLDSEDPLEGAEKKILPMLLSDDEEPIPPTPPVFQSTKKGKKKVMKTVQKTFQDEDGFFVTKQQKELVSASESDEEDPKPSKSSKDTVLQNLFTYRKQSSLTSFFK